MENTYLLYNINKKCRYIDFMYRVECRRFCIESIHIYCVLCLYILTRNSIDGQNAIKLPEKLLDEVFNELEMMA